MPPTAISTDSIGRFWEVLDEIQNSILFVLLGLEVLAIPLPRTYLASGAAAILASLGVRTLVLIALLAALRPFGKKHRSSVLVLGWGGLRGGLSLALALAVPRAPANDWILPTTYSVVVFTIVVQGWSIERFLRRSGDARQRLLGPSEQAR